ncbi:hypothetical protein LUZ60_001157 [Juncus effusus]|nr:hypothetical protein LUZ60_001157 [Juncus effusus]
MSFQNNQFKLLTTSLNPNAAEFVPSFRLPSAVSNASNSSAQQQKSTLDRVDSAKSTNSDDEARRYWQSQLPDDIIPDFSAPEKDETDSILPSLDSLALNEDPFYNTDAANQSAYYDNSNISWDQFETEYDLGFVDENSADNGVAGQDFDPLEYLVSQFPGFSAQSLSDLFYANGRDLNVTIETLIQLELQVDSGAHHTSTLNSSAPSFTMGDFPALPSSESQNPLSNGIRPGIVASSASNFVSAVRKIASPEPVQRRKDFGTGIGTSRVSPRQQSSLSSKLLAGSNNNKAPVWLETGEAVANMYTESRGEARDYARLRNLCFDQARQAYLIGNKALAKDLSVKGQLYNLQMKAAHGKAKESIFRQRNSGYAQGQVPLVDLHGLHVSEAIPILRQEISILRATARATGERVQLLVCVGTGHHTKGARTPARLPIAVEQFLLDQGLHFSQPQPGLFRVMIY